MEKLTARKEQILAAVIEKYLTSAAPVSSQTIAELYSFELSSATIRNELAVLTATGYLEQPHTSAGRIPTECGYRYYVDSLMNREILSSQEELATKNLLNMLNQEMEELLMRSSVLLANLTHYPALALIPPSKKPSWKHIDLLAMENNRILVIMIGTRGEIQKHLLDARSVFSENDLKLLEKVLNGYLERGESTIGQISPEEAYLKFSKESQRKIAIKVLELLQGQEPEECRMVVEGAHYFLEKPEFSDIIRLQPIFSALEEKMSLIKLLQGVVLSDHVVVRIGSELSPFADCSFVGAPYRFGKESIGTIGVLGPTRMNYAKAVAAVENIAFNLSQVLGKLQ